MNDKIKQYREEMTAKILQALKDGTAPWQQPWNGEGFPFNAVTRRKYNGANVIVLLSRGYDIDGGKDPRWLTFNQARANGWSVRKGEHGTAISFWKPLSAALEDKDGNQLMDKNGEPVVKTFLMEKLFTVFHASQVDGIPVYEPETVNTVEANEKAERIIADSGAEIRRGGFRSFYRPSEDFIQLPHTEFFTDTEGYYATALHELTHWTGHSSRLNRDLDCNKCSLTYAREELVAEIGSMFVSGETGIPQTEEHFKNHAAYIDGWISLLTSDANALFKAAADASRAAEFLLKKEREREREKEEKQAA